MSYCITDTYVFAPKKYTSSLVSYAESSRRPPRKQEIPSLSTLSVEHTPALIGDSVTTGIHFRSTTITVPIITSKMGRLTFPISGYQRHGFSCAPRIASFRNSWIPFISCYCRNSFSLWKSNRFVINLRSALTHRTDGHLWTVLAFWKHRRHQQNRGIIGTQSSDVTNVVLFRTLSTNRKRIGKRSVVSKG